MMKIEITEKNGKDLKEVDKMLTPFFDDVEKLYAESIEKGASNTMAKAMGISGSIRNSMPSEISHIHYIEGNKIIVKNNLPYSRFSGVGKMYNKVKDGLYRWLRDNGYECEVNILKGN
jgi:hypothetical protein